LVEVGIFGDGRLLNETSGLLSRLIGDQIHLVLDLIFVGVGNQGVFNAALTLTLLKNGCTADLEAPRGR